MPTAGVEAVETTMMLDQAQTEALIDPDDRQIPSPIAGLTATRQAARNVVDRRTV
jgi:hypothetical protein